MPDTMKFTLLDAGYFYNVSFVLRKTWSCHVSVIGFVDTITFWVLCLPPQELSSFYHSWWEHEILQNLCVWVTGIAPSTPLGAFYPGVCFPPTCVLIHLNSAEEFPEFCLCVPLSSPALSTWTSAEASPQVPGSLSSSWRDC